MSTTSIEYAIRGAGAPKSKILFPKVDDAIQLIHIDGTTQYTALVVVKRFQLRVEELSLKMESIDSNGLKADIPLGSLVATEEPTPGSDVGLFIYRVKVGDNAAAGSATHIPDAIPKYNNRILTVAAFSGSSSARTLEDLRVVSFIVHKKAPPPKITKAIVAVDGSYIVLYADAMITGHDGFTFEVKDAEASVTFDDTTDPGDRYRFNFDTSVKSGEKVEFAYTDPMTANSVKSVSGGSTKMETFDYRLAESLIPPEVLSVNKLNNSTFIVTFSGSVTVLGWDGFEITADGADFPSLSLTVFNSIYATLVLINPIPDAAVTVTMSYDASKNNVNNGSIAYLLDITDMPVTGVS